MPTTDLYDDLRVDRSVLEQAGFNPYYRALPGLQNHCPWLGRQPYVDLASNDYLGLACDRRVAEAMCAAVWEYGASMCGTPIATGYAGVFEELETKLAHFVGVESAVIFPSCYQANTSLFVAVATPEDAVLVDHYAHASLVQGIRACGCKVKPFLHNDLDHLERQLSGIGRFRQVFVVTESVFSTEGSVAPLGGIVELCRKHGAIPVVDDSHGLGVLGRQGGGILEAANLNDFPGIYTASLGKALANAGGMVGGRSDLIDALRYRCPGLIYSTALPPANAAGVLAVLEILASDFPRLAELMWRNHRELLATLRTSGFEVPDRPAPIASLAGGSAARTIRLARVLHEQRILTVPFVPPSVPEGRGVVRLIVGAKLDEAGMGQLALALRAAGTAWRGI